MEKKNIVTMPGDGIGKTFLPEALRVLDAEGFGELYSRRHRLGILVQRRQSAAQRTLDCSRSTGSDSSERSRPNPRIRPTGS